VLFDQCLVLILQRFEHLLVDHALRVVRQEPQLFLVEKLHLRDVHAVLSVQKLQRKIFAPLSSVTCQTPNLYDTSVTVSDCHVVADRQTFEMLDQAPLQVPTATGFDSSIDQTFAPRHAMKEELLGLYPGHESPVDETPSSGGELKNRKTRQRLSAYHDRGALALELDLTQQTRNLHSVHSRTFRPRLHHQL
jgi:hypothetical protein